MNEKKIDLDAASILALERIRSLQSDVFSEIVLAAGLDPRRDFINADLRKVDFKGSDLREFNFYGADLRGAKWNNVGYEAFKPSSALLGSGDAPVTWYDLERLTEAAKVSSRWADRFMATVLIVENFGTTPRIADTVYELVDSDRSKYFVGCTSLFFLGAYLENNEVCAYCKEMALARDSYPAIFRFNKARRYFISLLKYFQSVEEIPDRHPYFVPRYQVDEILSIGSRVF